MSSHATYLSTPLTSPVSIIRLLREIPSDIINPLLVGTGLSGTLALGVIRGLTDSYDVIVVRKDNDRSHSLLKVESSVELSEVDYERPWIFLDDLIDSGRTLERVVHKMESKGFTNLAGALLYHSLVKWKSADSLRKTYDLD